MMKKEIAQLLVAHGIRASQQRIAVMTFLKKCHQHPTVEMVYSALHPGFPTLSRSTVYQALDLFCTKGAVKRIIAEDGDMRYDAILSDHGHFRCITCGVISDFAFPEGTVLPIPSGDFKILHQYLFYQGICPSCQAGHAGKP